MTISWLKITGKFIKRLLIILVIAIIALAVFYMYNPKKALTLVFPDLDRISYVDAVIKRDTLNAKISMVLENKNPYKLVIDTISFDVLLNDSNLAHETVPLHLDQTRFDADTIPLPLRLDMKKVHRIIGNLQEMDSTDFEIRGFVVYETFLGRVKFDFHKKSRIEVPVPPKLKVIKVARGQFNIKDKLLPVVLTVEIINKGKRIDIDLIGVSYVFDVKDMLHSEGKINKDIHVKPQSRLVVDIPMEIKVFHPLKAVWLIKTDNDRLPYALDLKGMLKENMSENSFASPTEVYAEGMMELKK